MTNKRTLTSSVMTMIFVVAMTITLFPTPSKANDAYDDCLQADVWDDRGTIQPQIEPCSGTPLPGESCAWIEDDIVVYVDSGNDLVWEPLEIISSPGYDTIWFLTENGWRMVERRISTEGDFEYNIPLITGESYRVSIRHRWMGPERSDLYVEFNIPEGYEGCAFGTTLVESTPPSGDCLKPTEADHVEGFVAYNCLTDGYELCMHGSNIKIQAELLGGHRRLPTSRISPPREADIEGEVEYALIWIGEETLTLRVEELHDRYLIKLSGHLTAEYQNAFTLLVTNKRISPQRSVVIENFITDVGVFPFVSSTAELPRY